MWAVSNSFSKKVPTEKTLHYCVGHAMHGEVDISQSPTVKTELFYRVYYSYAVKLVGLVRISFYLLYACI